MDSSTLINEFTTAVESTGLPAPASIRADGELHRFNTNGKTGDDSGWYVLHSIGAGAFGCWRSGISEKWRTKATRRLSRDKQAELKRRMRDAAKRGRQERERKQAEAAEIAQAAWQSATPAPADHAYLQKKQIKPNGLRVDDDGQLLVPMAIDGQLVSLQLIDATGAKCFIPGGRTQGASCTLGTPGSKFYIAEGFADAATIREATGEAVSVGFNANNLAHVAKAMRKRYPDAKPIMAADNDCKGDQNIGLEKARAAAAAVGGSVAVPDLNGAACDFNDVAIQCGLDAVREQLQAAEPVAASYASQASHEYEQSKDESKSAATQLVEIASEQYWFGQTDDGETYAVPLDGPKIVATLRGHKQSLRAQVARIFFKRTGRAAPQQALADALAVVDGLAQEAEPEPLHLRIANAADAIWIDIGDTTGRAIRIADGEWSIKDTAPVLFKRTALNSALSDPERGSLSDLWQFLNVAEADRPLLAAWLVSAFYDGMAHPVLAFFGEQGTGKTTAQRMLVDLVDPSPVPTRKPPRDAESWVTAAAGSWVVGMDNLSFVPAWLSDSLCRAVTGDGDVRRRLYTDGEHSVFSYRRCIILNGIDLGATRGDLAERMLPIHLETIDETERVGDQAIWPHWEKVRAGVLGGLLELVADCASINPPALPTRPRMADFAEVLARVDTVLGTDGLAHYLEKLRLLATDALTSDSLMAAIDECLTGTFEGTSGELLDDVKPDKPPKDFPKNPREVTVRLNRNAPALRKAGWHVSNDSGNNHRNTTCWMLIPPTRPYLSRKTPSPDSQSVESIAAQGLKARVRNTGLTRSVPRDSHADSQSASQTASNASQRESETNARLAGNSHYKQQVSDTASQARHEYGQSKDKPAADNSFIV